ncbi:MAG: NAD(P)/FAD-dependent oxidoreductase [Clostridiales bacterium]|nr:NAD(P)/FAD-dependent oxidoreductase [Clostridiales bacterium]
MPDYDVVIIGAGVTGCAVAMELARYDLRICVVDKDEDVCSGTSKANSGIVHAGHDALPGTLKAKLNVRGSEMIRELSERLDFPFRENGSMVVASDDDGTSRQGLEELLERGRKNGVKDLRIITGDEARTYEPNLSEDIKLALLVPHGGIVCPFLMTAAFAENAASNGAEFRFLTVVTDISRTDSGYLLSTAAGSISAAAVVNCAGIYADKFHNMICPDQPIHITPRRGEYVLLDHDAGDITDHTIFRLPTSKGKGVLVTPTAHGNMLVGPNAEDLEDKEDTSTTLEGMNYIKSKALDSVPGIPYAKTITSFSGLRATEDGKDFIVGESADGFFDAAGIDSPGLSSAPAIGEMLADMIAAKFGAALKEDYISTRKGFVKPLDLGSEELAALIQKDPAYGRIVCRCENVTEGEIRDAIRRNPGARSLDGIKRRVRQGMGRCQAGFCTPRTISILSEELGIPEEEICKNVPGSELLLSKEALSDDQA